MRKDIDITAAIERAVEEERERCARIVEQYQDDKWSEAPYLTLRRKDDRRGLAFAAAIRSGRPI